MNGLCNRQICKCLIFIYLSGIKLLSNCIKICVMKKLNVVLMCLVALFASCTKDVIPDVEKTDRVIRRVLTPEEALLKEKLAVAAQVVRDVVLRQPAVVEEVSDLIGLKLYRDDYIYFRDLFGSVNSNKGVVCGAPLFEKTFDEVIESKSGDINFPDIKEYLVTNNITLYCPYPVEDYPAENQLPSCTSDPLDNDVINTGYQLESDGSYSVVDITEEYSEDYPVWIVMPEEEDIITMPVPTNPLPGVHQLRVGHVKCTKQYDGLFGGGSEFKFCLLGGTITLTTASSFMALQSCNLTRSQIRRKVWVNFQYELDDDWYVSSDGSTDEGGRQFGLIEFDKNKTTFTISFEPKVKIDKIDVSTGKIELKIESAEGWIKLDNFLSRDTFERFNKVDMGNGIQDAFRIYTAGCVSWTLPLIEY